MQTKLGNISVPRSTWFKLTIPAQHVRPDGDWCNECTTRMASSLFACSTPAPENDNINNIIMQKSIERLAIHVSWWYKDCKRVCISTGEANTAKPIPDNMAVKREWLTTISGCLMFKHDPKCNESVRWWSGNTYQMSDSEWLLIYGTLYTILLRFVSRTVRVQTLIKCDRFGAEFPMYLCVNHILTCSFFSPLLRMLFMSLWRRCRPP